MPPKAPKTEAEEIANAPALNPDSDYSLVHGHKTYAFKQNGIYYDYQGEACAIEPKPPSVNRTINRLRQPRAPKTPNAGRPATETTVGSVPKTVANARQENAKAKAAEELFK